MNKKEILNQFFDKAIKDKKSIIILTYNFNSGESSPIFVKYDYIESYRTKLSFMNDNLEDEVCKCRKIIDFFIVDIIERGSDYI